MHDNLTMPLHIDSQYNRQAEKPLKISDKIADYKSQGKVFYSFEYFPPKTPFGLQNLYNRLDRMAALNPAFIDITWGAGGSTADQTLSMSETIQKYFGVNVMMHLTCTNMAEDRLSGILSKAKSAGISNILALRGDAPDGSDEWEKCRNGFNFAKDLVSHIRKTHGETFCVGVAGYPEKHTEQNSLDLEIEHLKQKVDAGADLIITQLFYDLEKFLIYRDKVRAAGIKIPIIPGIMPIHNYSRFKKFTQFANVSVPATIVSDLEDIKLDDAKVIDYGIDQAYHMASRLIEEGTEGLHFYTLNLESSVAQILNRLGLSNAGGTARELPWRQSGQTQRNQSEEIRPIYWSNRPVSYLARTHSWDDFPNGRWGDSSSPTFGELNTYHVIRHASKLDKIKLQRQKLWGEPKSEEDIAKVFSDFCRGKINSLPWCELPLANESNSLVSELEQINRDGFLTINSQPRLNGCKSEDPVHGWGAAGGRIYQKAYLEFFTSKERFEELKHRIPEHKTLSMRAFKSDGTFYSNTDDSGVTAVTWGVFPNKEILQPTVVDTRSFKIWKDEAFELWLNEWASIYPQESLSAKVLGEVHKTYYLVNLVDHDYVEGDIFSIFNK